MKYTLFIFRRDLRLNDNKGLIQAMKHPNVLPIFIFTPEQIKSNDYKSDNAVQFMCESLKDLDKSLKKYNSKMHYFYGENIVELEQIIKKIDVNAIVTNKDFTPYAIKRDKAILELCGENDIEFILGLDISSL